MAYSLFSVYGVELEYMIVDQNTLRVKPIADKLLHSVIGSYESDFENGKVDWSNELVNHVIEIKTHQPEASLVGLAVHFQQNVDMINQQLKAFNAMLLPTGAHPTMDPYQETQLWPHEHREIYTLYNRIFDCRGHGWSNLQSTHINLPFNGDEEFARLHAAVRLMLPIIPGLSASTPMLDGQLSGFTDTRLETYRTNQQKIPIIAGLVIPERVYSHKAYEEAIFKPVRQAIAPYDKDKILDHHFLNSRGAIARFDRGAIEIRIIDIQECPSADLAILELVSAVLRKLCAETWNDWDSQSELSEQELAHLFQKIIKEGEDYNLEHLPYLEQFGIDQPLSVGELWSYLLGQCRADISPEAVQVIEYILSEGSLSTRISKALGKHPDGTAIQKVYGNLAQCLASNHLF